jgi:PST family polysaccharide transporter
MTGQAFSMGWFYNAIEDLRPALFADLSANTVSTLAIVLLVRTPADVWKVLAIQGVAFTAAAVVALWWAARTSGFARPSWRSLKARLRTGRAVFGYRAALASYSVGNAFLLGCLAPAAQVGYFSAAERLVRALIALSYPIAQALYPRVHYHAGRRDEKAHQLAKLGLAACAVIGVLCGSIAVSAAPWFLPRILGSGFGSSLEIFRILALLCPLVAVNTVLAFQWLLPRFLDASLTGITIAAGVINVGAAFFVVPRYGALGMACTVVAAEVFVLAGCLLSLWKYGDAESSIQARTDASI